MTEAERPDKNKNAETRGSAIEALSGNAKTFIEGFIACADILGQKNDQEKSHDHKQTEGK